MSKKAGYLLGILLTIVLGLLFCYFLCCCNCCQKESCKKNKVETKSSVISYTANPFEIKDANGDISFKNPNNFKFNASSFKILNPNELKLDTEILQIKNYLNLNPSQIAEITGYYNDDEVNSSAYPDIGLARANAVKNYFAERGIPTQSLNTFGKLNNAFIADSLGVFHGPFAFAFAASESRAENNKDTLKALKRDIKANPLVLYFNSGESSIPLTAAQRQLIANISRYLDKVPQDSCLVVGHSDNVGTAEKNLILAKERADFIKNYLIQNAIPENKITVISKGETQPIADNNTEEGKAKNRRAEVTIN